MDKESFSRLFPIGSHLCREPMPEMNEMKRDMENLKRHGFNLVKLQEQWACDEAFEGQYDFSVYEELIDHAAKLDMGVYLGFTMEQAPHWLYEKHPDCRMVRKDGVRVAYEPQAALPSDGKPGPCFDHKAAEDESLKFLRKAVSTLGRYENIVVWNVWQEIGIQGESSIGQMVCYCENTILAFREWLKRSHGSLDALNRAWKTRYPVWDLVRPNQKFGNDVSLPQDIEWRYFMENIRLAEIVSRRTQAVKDADPLKRPVFAHMAAATPGSGAEWNFARASDFLGVSCYPTPGAGIHKWDDAQKSCREDVLLSEVSTRVALPFDYFRSLNPANAPVWGAEFQGGPVAGYGEVIGRTPLAADIRRWMLTAVGSGATAISFWVTRAEIAAQELNGYGLLDSIGDETERFREAGRIAEALNQYPDIFAGRTTEQAPVAILIDDVNYRYCQSARIQEFLTYSVRGWYRLLWDNDITVDFIEASELGKAYAAGYRAIIAPFPFAMRDDTARSLAAYVENGGKLISEACPGRCDGYGYGPRGEMAPALTKLFGCSQKSLKMVGEPGNGSRWTNHDYPWGTFSKEEEFTGTGRLQGAAVPANLYAATFNCEDSEACLRSGNETAGTVRAAGRGLAWLLGTFVGFNGTAYVNRKTHDFVLKILAENGIEPDYPGRLKFRRRVAGSREAWVLTNTVTEQVTEKISARGFTAVKDLFGDKIELTNGMFELTVAPLDVRVIITEK